MSGVLVLYIYTSLPTSHRQAYLKQAIRTVLYYSCKPCTMVTITVNGGLYLPHSHAAPERSEPGWGSRSRYQCLDGISLSLSEPSRRSAIRAWAKFSPVDDISY
jgi:hypothetical protein